MTHSPRHRAPAASLLERWFGPLGALAEDHDVFPAPAALAVAAHSPGESGSVAIAAAEVGGYSSLPTSAFLPYRLEPDAAGDVVVVDDAASIPFPPLSALRHLSGGAL